MNNVDVEGHGQEGEATNTAAAGGGGQIRVEEENCLGANLWRFEI